MDRPLDVDAVHLAVRLAVLTNGAVVSVTSMYDRDGRLTRNPKSAVSFVCGNKDVGWFSGIVADFPKRPAS